MKVFGPSYSCHSKWSDLDLDLDLDPDLDIDPDLEFDLDLDLDLDLDRDLDLDIDIDLGHNPDSEPEDAVLNHYRAPGADEAGSPEVEDQTPTLTLRSSKITKRSATFESYT